MDSLSTADSSVAAASPRPPRVRPGFQLGLAVLLAGGALAVSLLGYLETRNRLEHVERGVDTLVTLREPRFYRLEAARRETARFANAHLLPIDAFPNKMALLDHAVGQIPSDSPGFLAEFGVYRGKTINHIASQTERTVHGFDSFEGLPENWRDGFEKGAFRMDGLPKVRPNVVLHKGWFDETLPGFRDDVTGTAAFLHLDADLYSSTKTVLDGLADRIVPGTVIVFDEFLGYPGWQQGEFRAFQEFTTENGVRFEYIGWVPTGEQVAVRILPPDETTARRDDLA